MTTATFEISDHARERLIERGGPDLDLEMELAGAVPYGAQFGKSFLLLLPCGMIAAGENSERGKVIATVLTQDQAAANMQMKGLAMRATFPTPIQSTAVLPVRQCPAPAMVQKVKPLGDAPYPPIPEEDKARTRALQAEREKLADELNGIEAELIQLKHYRIKKGNHRMKLIVRKDEIARRLREIRLDIASRHRDIPSPPMAVIPDRELGVGRELIQPDGSVDIGTAALEILRWIKRISVQLEGLRSKA